MHLVSYFGRVFRQGYAKGCRATRLNSDICLDYLFHYQYALGYFGGRRYVYLLDCRWPRFFYPLRHLYCPTWSYVPSRRLSLQLDAQGVWRILELLRLLLRLVPMHTLDDRCIRRCCWLPARIKPQLAYCTLAARDCPDVDPCFLWLYSHPAFCHYTEFGQSGPWYSISSSLHHRFSRCGLAPQGSSC